MINMTNTYHRTEVATMTRVLGLFLLLIAGNICGSSSDGSPPVDDDVLPKPEPDTEPPVNPPPSLPLSTRGVPDPVIHTPAPTQEDFSTLQWAKNRPIFPLFSLSPCSACETRDRFLQDFERCRQQGGTVEECAGLAGLCLVRDQLLDRVHTTVFYWAKHHC